MKTDSAMQKILKALSVNLLWTLLTIQKY